MSTQPIFQACQVRGCPDPATHREVAPPHALVCRLHAEQIRSAGHDHRIEPLAGGA